MKKAKGEDGGGGSKSMISELPEGILPRIIYFLPQEEAVRTSILSKSWRYIWCTRPNIDFSETTFKGGNKHEFLSAVDKTLQRYCDQGLYLEEFKLTISLLGGGDDQESVSNLHKWIPIVLTALGVALKEFRLSIVSKKRGLVYDLTNDLPEDNKKIHFKRLQVLRLQKVLIKQETFDRIVSTCTLLTTVWLEDCKGLRSIKLEKKLYKHLKHFTFISDKSHNFDKSTIEIDDVQTLETIKIVRTKIRFHGRHKFNNLKSITLKLSCYETEEICIDAPNLLYFEYSGSVIPSIPFAPNCRRSNIELVYTGELDAVSWFFKASQLLQALHWSEISLNIDNILRLSMHIPQDSLVNGGNKPVVVEHLQLSYFSLPSLPLALNGVLCICRPRNITHAMFKHYPLNKEVEQEKLAEYLCTLLMVGRSENQEIRQDLESVSIQKRFGKFEKIGSKWEPIQWTAFLECPQLNLIRFQLEWNEACQSSPRLHKLVGIVDND